MCEGEKLQRIYSFHTLSTAADFNGLSSVAYRNGILCTFWMENISKSITQCNLFSHDQLSQGPVTNCENLFQVAIHKI